MGYLLGIDLGSSSVKASLLDADTGQCAGTAFSPAQEQRIDSPQPGYAEQDPDLWMENSIKAIAQAKDKASASPEDIDAVGISYQMHGLVCLDSDDNVLRPAIIWCDSRAVPYGEKAFADLGKDKCLSHLLNSPGNFTASKLAWVKENEPDIYAQTAKILLPGDWLALQLTGRPSTTASGLSEGVLWDYLNEDSADFLLEYFGFDKGLLAERVPSFGPQGEISKHAAEKFGLKVGTPVAYRGGDQPNNALSLNVLQPGEIAATAGTSGVVYGVSESKKYDPKSRFNIFLHLNHEPEQPRLGLLLCINGTGIMNSWTRNVLGSRDYTEMNDLAASSPIGSKGLRVFPFGNGAERMFGNWTPGASLSNLDLNRHGRAEICRAVQEGIAFSFQYGMDIMRSAGIDLKTIRAGEANMFLSPIFCETLAGISGARIELYDTDGSLGAARGAGVGSGVYSSFEEAFATLEKRRTITADSGAYQGSYNHWKQILEQKLEQK